MPRRIRHLRGHAQRKAPRTASQVCRWSVTAPGQTAYPPARWVMHATYSRHGLRVVPHLVSRRCPVSLAVVALLCTALVIRLALLPLWAGYDLHADLIMAQ